MKKIRFLKNRKILLSIYVFLGIIIFFNIQKISDRILFITFWALVLYAWETWKIREIEEKPIMLLYVRNIKDYDLSKHRKIEDYLIRIRTEEKNSDYFLRLRNTGKGTAFNIRIESDIFEIFKYESRFFAPLKDEHSIGIIKKGCKKIESWDELNGAVLKIYCKNTANKSYCFKYKIIDVKNKEVEFLGEE